MVVEIALIGAMDERRAIGRGNKLLWKLPEDMKFFRKITGNHPVVMGRRTYDSIGHPLPGRRNIVLTRNPGFTATGVETAASPEQAIEMTADAARLCVIGGGDVYEAFLPYADALYITHIGHTWDADAFFPAWKEEEWRLVWDEPGKTDTRNPYLYRFCEYRRVRS